MISECNRQMLALLADVLHERTPEKIAADVWPTLKKELHDQAVYALPSAYLPSLGLPAEEENIYMREIIRHRQSFHRLMKEQTQTLSLLEAEGIAVVVLKGAAAAIGYSHPEDRCMGDIDLLVAPPDFDKAYHAFLAAGYTPDEGVRSDSRHIGMTTKNGIRIELHRFFSHSDSSAQNAVLDERLYQAIPARSCAEVCGYPFSMLPPMENGMVLLSHINQHLPDGLGLRQIIDWMLFVEKHLDDALWENGFSDFAEQIGMKRLAILTTAMCQKYLGLQKDIHWSSYEPVCDELMEYVLSLGNFGHKNDKVTRLTEPVLRRTSNPIRALANAQAGGLSNWDSARRHPLLRPFAWCYQLGRWVKRGLENGVSIRLISKASGSAKETAALIKKLGVTNQ